MEVVGTGKHSIYLYYFPVYRMQREDAGYDTWPCKIGYSNHNVLTRIKSQVKTSSPQKPIIGLIVRTNDAYLLEQALHGILRLFHKDLKQATGVEWFETSPEEVLALCRMLRQC